MLFLVFHYFVTQFDTYFVINFSIKSTSLVRILEVLLYILCCLFVSYSSYNFSADGFSALTASLCGVPLSARSNVDWMRKLSFRYRRIRDVYAANCTNITGNMAAI